MKMNVFMIVILLVTEMGWSQNSKDLDMIRASFQEIQTEDDIQTIQDFKINGTNPEIANVINAYKGASRCMMANYVFAPTSKLTNFNEGKRKLEASIEEKKGVENVYLRLLIQLNAPKIVNYRKNIDADIMYLEQFLTTAPIDLKFKTLMIENILTVVKKEEQKEVLLHIDLE